MTNPPYPDGNRQGGGLPALALFVATVLPCFGAAPVVEEDGAVPIEISPLLNRSAAIARVDAGKPLNVVLVLPLRDAQGAEAFAGRVANPRDPLYGKFLSPEEFGEKFGATAADYAALKAWATKHRLSINEESKSRTTLSVRGTAGQFEELFKTQLNNYRTAEGKEFLSAASSPTVPAEIASKVGGVVGLTGSVKFAPLVMKYDPKFPNGAKPGANVAGNVGTNTAGGTGPGGAYSASDLRTVYQIPTGFGPAKTETVAVFEQGGFDPNDIKVYLSQNKLPEVPVKVRNVNGYRGAINDPNVEIEAVLDIDMVLATNPAVKQVLVYEEGDDDFGVALLDSLAAMANDRTAQTVSISYGTDEKIQGKAQITAEGQLFTQLAAQGQTVFVSSGDGGAYGRSGVGLNAPDPGSQPRITSVGGTSLFTGPRGVYLYEEVWNKLALGGGATGGGVSAYWPIPGYQIVPGSEPAASVATANGGSATKRNVPDVAAVGDPYTGVAVYSALNGGWVQIGGTSVSSPIWAGYLSIVNGARSYLGLGKGIGEFNPLLYRIAQGLFFPPLNDVADGTNGNVRVFGIPGFDAGYGYDNCTGWGTIQGGNFAYSVLTTNLGSGTPPGVARGLFGTVTKNSATVSWTAGKGATGYIVEAIDYATFQTAGLKLTTGTSVKFTGLLPKTTYVFFVDSVNPNGTSENDIFLTTPAS